VTDVVRNLVHNPAMRATSGTVEVARNRVTNPVVGVNLTGWGNLRTSILRVAYGDGFRVQATITALEFPGFPGQRVEVPQSPVTPGETITLGARFFPNGLYTTAATNMRFRDSGGAVVSEPGSVVHQVPDGAEYVDLYRTVVVPAGAATVSFYVGPNDAAEIAVGGVFYVTAGQVTPGAVQWPLFAGDSAASGEFTHAWVGVPHASESVKLGRKVAGTEDSSLVSYQSEDERLVLVPTGVDNNCWTIAACDLEPGGTYTALGTVDTPVAQVGTLHPWALRTLVVACDTPGPGLEYLRPEPGPAQGRAEIRFTFTVPADASRADLRLYNGSDDPADLVLWDNVLVVEGDYRGPYFDGDTPDVPSPRLVTTTYTWEGDPAGSVSRREVVPFTIPVSSGDAESVEPGQVQYGQALLGSGTLAGWLELIGWRDHAEVQVSDAPRPQSHGAYPGDVLADALTVTFRYLLRGNPAAKQEALRIIEQHTGLRDAEQRLAVNDGDGTWFRLARVIGRQVPQGVHFTHAPLECALQFLCADPRRYSTTEKVAEVRLAESSGGLEYPLVYPLGYGESSSGAVTANNGGTEDTPPLLTFHGPLDSPVLATSQWSLGFDLNLADGELLQVDTNQGTVLLNGSADRLYTIRNDSTPLERCLLRPGSTNLTLTAASGTGRVVVAYRDARM
jgi:hypothetical protein